MRSFFVSFVNVASLKKSGDEITPETRDDPRSILRNVERLISEISELKRTKLFFTGRDHESCREKNFDVLISKSLWFIDITSNQTKIYREESEN